jgi:predicted RNA-binding protein with PUA-like domain
MDVRYWLVKSEPAEYGIDDLERDGDVDWSGVRNYQARNHLREMSVGEPVLFYHSSTDPRGIVGVARVHRAAYPDETAFDRRSPYFDAPSRKDAPRWYAVDLAFVERFPAIMSLDALRAVPDLADFPLLRRGQRLSVLPVSPRHFEIIASLGRLGAASSPERRRNTPPPVVQEAPSPEARHRVGLSSQ